MFTAVPTLRASPESPIAHGNARACLYQVFVLEAGTGLKNGHFSCAFFETGSGVRGRFVVQFAIRGLMSNRCSTLPPLWRARKCEPSQNWEEGLWLKRSARSRIAGARTVGVPVRAIRARKSAVGMTGVTKWTEEEQGKKRNRTSGNN